MDGVTIIGLVLATAGTIAFGISQMVERKNSKAKIAELAENNKYLVDENHDLSLSVRELGHQIKELQTRLDLSQRDAEQERDLRKSIQKVRKMALAN